MYLKKNLKVPPWLVDAVLRIEDQHPDRRLVMLFGGVPDLGKTTGIIQLIRHLGSKQKPDEDNVRALKFFILRESYRQVDHLIDSFREWFDVGTYDDILKGKHLGFGFKDIKNSPKLVITEKTPDLVGLLTGEPYEWDGTITRVEIQVFSYNKPSSDANMRGGNLGSGFINEAQTLVQAATDTAQGRFGRPSGQVVNPVLLIDFNMPSKLKKDPGYDYLKRLWNTDTDALNESDIYVVKLPAPYRFERDVNGDFLFQGQNGHLIENEQFLLEAPHLKNLDGYKVYKHGGDDIVRTNLLGMFGTPIDGNAIYHEFDRSVHAQHLVDPPNPLDHPKQLILIGIDFGYTPAVLFAYVEDGIPYFFHEIAIEDINFYELLQTYIIPYLEEKLPYYYDRDQIVFIGDPQSGNRRSAMKSATPINVLLGITDINGDPAGTDTTYNFSRTVPSPCGNSIEHRLHVTKQVLSKKNGMFISSSMTRMTAMFEEYIENTTTGKPLKKAGNLLHGLADAFQYVISYLYAGAPYKLESSRAQKKKTRPKRHHKRYR